VRPVVRWDRGTLLVEGDPPADPERVWDERVGRWRLPAWRWRAIRERVIDQVVPVLPRPPSFAPGELRAYQRDAVAAWEAAGRWGTVVLPTGAGKTRTALAAIAGYRRRTLVIVPTNVLVALWCSAFEKLGVRPGRYAEGARDEQPITVATFASARIHAETLGNRFGLLVVDEAHHFGGGPGDEVLEQCVAEARLGLTATPVEGDRAARVAELIGPVVFAATVDALTGTWLAPLDVRRWTLELTPDERAAYDREVAVFAPVCRQFFANNRGAGWLDFSRECQRSERGRAALLAWRRSRAIVRFPEAKRAALRELLGKHADRRVLVFAADAASACDVAREHLVPLITADVGAAERTEILARFAAGDWRVLVSARVLNEGVDVPAADTAILLSGTQGPREYVQRVGRVLRPSPGKQAVVYDLVMRDTFEVPRAERHRERLDA
jgi:superfamily II DNA or RNA helicase